MAGSGSGSSKLLTKLKEAMEGHKYYEAHQLVKTINFRYTSAQKYDELEELLRDNSAFLLDNKQFESGMDVAIMLCGLYKTADRKPTPENVDVAVKLLKKMPPSPERGQFITLLVEWVPVGPSESEFADKINLCAATMYLEEREFHEAWEHIIRLQDGKLAAALTSRIIQSLGNSIRPEEKDLIVAHLLLTFLAAKKVRQAEEALVSFEMTIVDESLSSPLMRGVRFLIEAAKTNDAMGFKSLQVLYLVSFARDPKLVKLVTTAGKNLFNIGNERGVNHGGLMSTLINALMSGETPT